MLMHHADPRANGITGSVEGNGLVVDQDVASSRTVKPAKHIHQSRFARPVFTQQPKDFACADRQVHILVGRDRAETFCDAAQGNVHLLAPTLWAHADCAVDDTGA